MELLPYELWENITMNLDQQGYHSLRQSHKQIEIPFIQKLRYTFYWKRYLALKKQNSIPSNLIMLHPDSINNSSFIGILRLCDWVGASRCLLLSHKISTKHLETACDILYYHAHECRDYGYAELARKIYFLGRVKDDYQTQDAHSLCDNLFIKLFAHTGDVEIIRKLIQNPIVNPRSDHHIAFYTACIYGHLDIVKLLFPFADMISIESACQYGQTEIVRFLLAVGVDPTFPYNYPFIRACERGHVEIVGLLLAHVKVDPYVLNHEALYRACLEGHLNVVILLLNQQFDPGPRKTEIVETAKTQGHTEILQVLLKDHRFH
jgi:hypothetical protein